MTKRKSGNTPDLQKKDFYDQRFTPKQLEFQKTIRESTITICRGSAGSSKTYTSCYTALMLLAEGKVDKIILTKPYQESGENLGFLPGDLGSKLQPYYESFWDNINQIIPKQYAQYLLDTGKIILEPLAYMRGRSFSNNLLLLDEAQNASIEQLVMLITRMSGMDGKVIICGDVSQHDIAERLVALPTLGKMLDGVTHDEHKVSFFEFTPADVVRHPLLVEITDRYEKFKYSEEGRKSGLFKK